MVANREQLAAFPPVRLSSPSSLTGFSTQEIEISFAWIFLARLPGLWRIYFVMDHQNNFQNLPHSPATSIQLCSSPAEVRVEKSGRRQLFWVNYSLYQTGACLWMDVRV